MYWMADTLGLDNSTPSWTPVRLGTPRTASMGHGQRVTPTELLQRSTLRVLGRNLPSWSFGLAGGAWSATTGDPLGLVSAALGLVSGVLGLKGSDLNMAAAYSYLFQAQRTFAR